MNVQNIPRSDKLVKKAFLPKHDAFLFFDYKQIEPRLLAYYLAVAVGDTRMADSVKAGIDPYTAIVAPMYGKTPDTLTDEERQQGKKLFLSLQYGGGVKTIIKQWRIDYPAAKAMYNQFHNTWPSVKMLNNGINAMVAERGFARSISGRHLRPDSEHKAVNSLCQGSASEFMRQSLTAADRFCGENMLVSHLVLTIHDELVFDSPKSEIPLLMETIPGLMNCYPEVSSVVPIQVDKEISYTNWAEKEEYVG